MSKLKKSSRYDGNFALLPDEMLTSDAGRTLPYAALAVLAALAAQFDGTNNGSLTLPRRSIKPTQSSAAKYGISNPYVIDRSFRELEERGLIVCTLPGRRLPPRAAMYALTWWPINDPIRLDPHDARPTLTASHQWTKWKAERHEKRARGGKVYSFTERYWSVPEPEMRKVRHRNFLLQPRDTRPSSPGIHAKAEISSPGIHAGGVNPVAQGYSSEISGGGGTGNSKARGGEAGGRAIVDVPGEAQRGGQAQKVPAPAVPQPVAANLGSDVEDLLARACRNREQRKVKFGRPATDPKIDPKPNAGEPPSADEAVIQRARERAAAKLPRSSPRYWPEQRRLFAIELLAADGAKTRSACGQLIGWRYQWYGPEQVDAAVLECEAKLIYGAAAFEFIKNYPFDNRDGAGGQEREGAPRITVQ